MLKIKRIYQNAANDDGLRILVDRLWPRGVSKDRAKVQFWMKELAPSDALRKWFDHKPEKWNGFKKKYYKELASKSEYLDLIKHNASKGTVTLVYGSKEEKLNNAAALAGYITKETK